MSTVKQLILESRIIEALNVVTEYQDTYIIVYQGKRIIGHIQKVNSKYITDDSYLTVYEAICSLVGRSQLIVAKKKAHQSLANSKYTLNVR